MIVSNCPALEDILEWTGEFDARENPIMTLDTADYCVKHKKSCKEVENCVVKTVIAGNGKFEVEHD